MTLNDSASLSAWKRPWNLNEIVDSSQCWSLAADSGVCELLKSFSTDLLNEIAQLNNSVNELSIESKQTNVIIQNAFNDFCMLANDQFMENLVEDVGSCQVEKMNGDDSSNKDEKVVQIVPLVAESIKLGMQVLEAQFEILEMVRHTSTTGHESDSSETGERSSTLLEYVSNEPMYQPRDPYEHRHLPHLIGTTAFVEDETLGIGFIDDMDEMQDASLDEDEDAPGDEAVDDDLTSGFSSDESDDDDPPVQLDRSLRKRDSLSGSDIFDRKSEHNESEEDIFDQDIANHMQNNKPEPSKPPTLQDQLHDQLKKKLGLSVNIESNNVNSNFDDDLSTFNNDHESVTASMSQSITVKQSTQSPLQSSSKTNLSFPDDDDDDLFRPTPQVMKTQIAPSLSKPAVTRTDKIDSDSDDDLFKQPVARSDKVVPAIAPVPSTNVPNNKKGPAIFLDSDDSDNDIFDILPKKTIAHPPPVEKIQAKTIDKTIQPQLNANADKTNPIITTEVKKPFIFNLDDDDDDDDLFKPAVPKPKGTTAEKSPLLPPASKLVKNESSDDDVLFGNDSSLHKLSTQAPTATNDKTDTKDQSKPPPIETKPTQSINKPSNQNRKHSSDEDSLFDSNESKSRQKSQHQTVPINKVDKNHPREEPVKLTQSIRKISSSSDDSLFGGSSSSKQNTGVEKTKSSIKSMDNSNTNEIAQQSLHVKKEATDVPKMKPTKIEHTNKEISQVHDPLLAARHEISAVEKNELSEDDLFIHSTTRSSMKSKPTNLDTNSKNVDELTTDTNNVDQHLTVEVELVTSEKEILHKLPAGAVNPFGNMDSSIRNSGGMSILDEMKIRNRKSVLEKTFPQKDDLVEIESPKFEPPLAAVSNSDFKEKLQQNLLQKMPFHSPSTIGHKSGPMRSDSGHNDDIDTNQKTVDFDKPMQEVRQLTLLTKARPRNVGRKRPGGAPSTGTSRATADVHVSDDKPEDQVGLVDPVPITVRAPSPVATTTTVTTESAESVDIFANLPLRPDKISKTAKKSKLKSSASSRKPVDVNEIDDIFAIPSTASSSKPSSRSKSTKSKSANKTIMDGDDPLGALQ